MLPEALLFYYYIQGFVIILDPGYNPISWKGEFFINQFHGHLLMNM